MDFPIRRLAPLAAALAVCLFPSPARAQESAAETAPTVPAAALGPADPTELADEEPNPAIPDFTTINLPTTLRLPRHRSAFRITHRFGRPLGDGSFKDLLQDFFGLDSGAQVGFELRFGLFSGTQLGVLRTSDRTIQFFAERELVRQGASPVGLAVYGTFEGLDNLRVEHSPGIGLVASRTLGTRAALYALPAYVVNTNLVDEEGEENNTVILGLAGRLRLSEGTAVVGEIVPRIAGHAHQGTHATFGFEHRVGGHNFQLNFSNAFGNTLAQVARGGGAIIHEAAGHTHGSDTERAWYIGFNLSRKFY